MRVAIFGIILKFLIPISDISYYKKYQIIDITVKFGILVIFEKRHVIWGISRQKTLNGNVYNFRHF